MNNLKILGFDNWTRGAHHFARLVPALANQGIVLELLHLGSWGNDRGRPHEEMIGDLAVRDIAYYNELSFDEILEREQPSAVIFLSTQTFAHRAFLRYCKKRSIPTLHLYHGLVNVQVTDDVRGSYKVNRFAYFQLVISKLGKLFNRTFPCYMAALIRTDAKYSDWARFLKDIGRMALGKSSLVAADDAKTTLCAVYTNADIEHAQRTYGFTLEQVLAVGNPDLARFGLREEMLGSRLNRGEESRESVMYIDTGLASIGLIFNSYAAFIRHLINTAEELAVIGIKLLFKPHPAHDIAVLQAGLSDTEIELVSNEEFLTRLNDCVASIVETTTLAMVPALMGMPVLFGNFQELEELRFGPVLTCYPRGHVLRNVVDIINILETDSDDLDIGQSKGWIFENAGPLPADLMPSRVAGIVASMIGHQSIDGLMLMPRNSNDRVTSCQ